MRLGLVGDWRDREQNMKRRTFIIDSTLALGAVALGRLDRSGRAEAGPITTDAIGDQR